MTKIRVANLDFAYKNGKKVLSEVNLEVEKGEALTLVGPNGSGKTTLLKNIAGALRPNQGVIYLDMDELSRLSSREIAKKVAVLQQETRVGFDFTVKEIVQMGRIPHLGRFRSLNERDKRSILKAMKLTGVKELVNRSIREISGGERQRVFLACALAQEPELLLLDEPTSNLDINYQIEIMETVRDQVSKDIAVIMALHDLNLAAHYSDRLALMKAGQVMNIGPPSEVLTEENIRIAFGTEVAVRRNPLNNSVYIDIPSKKTAAQKGQRRLHIVCGGGSGIEVFHTLSNHFQLSCGVLSPLDSDYNAAKHLGVKTITEAPFSPISESTYRENLELMRQSDAIIVCETPFGEGNILNLNGVAKLSNEKDVFLLKPETIDKRDYTKGKEATKLLNHLVENGGKPVHNLEYLLDQLISVDPCLSD